MAQQLIIGIHAVTAVLKQQPERVQRLLMAPVKIRPKMQAILDKCKQAGIAVEQQSKAELDKLSNGNHQGVIAFCKASNQLLEADLPNLIESTDNPLLLILDGVTDPHNLGACLRTADAAGVSAVIIPKDKSVGITEVVAKVACGAAETMPLIQVTNLSRCMQQLQQLGVWLVGTSGDSEQLLYDVDLRGAVALVMGAEGDGIRRLTAENCDYLAKLPMAGYVSSLNVSVATGVCLFEAVRQRSV